MKPLLFSVILLLGLAASSAFEADSKPATVEKQNGLFIFWDCKPADAYEVIGHTKIKGLVATGYYDDMLKHFIKKSKANYPTADGIIYDGDIHDMDEVDVIKFK